MTGVSSLRSDNGYVTTTTLTSVSVQGVTLTLVYFPIICLIVPSLSLE